MKSLRRRFESLPPPQRREVHFELCQHALAVWRDFAKKNPPQRYIESVLGSSHEVDVGLPAQALEAARQSEDLHGVSKRYGEPISALQDDDLEFPDHIEFAYYAVYNLFQKYVAGRAIDDWLIVNQALSASTDEASWAPALSAAIAKAEGSA